MSEPEDKKKPSGIWWSWKRFLIAGVVIITLSGATTATGLMLEIQDIVDAVKQGGTLNLGDEITEAEAGQPQTILLLGSDERWIDKQTGSPARSDTMILLRLDPERGHSSVMSIPRDLIVDIPVKGGVQKDKLNAAYSLGGLRLTIKVIKALTGIKINHVVNVNFGGFRRAVDRLGCVYADVDRRYFNDNSQGGDEQYAVINIKPGYQRLCGQNALSYVRFRHEDNDIVRAARQQDFLRQAKQQVGVQKIFDDRKALVTLFGRYTQTDINDADAILQLITLGLYSADKPVREVKFPAILGDADVTANPAAIKRAAKAFMAGKSAQAQPASKPKTKKKKKKQKSAASATGLVEAKTEGEDQAIKAAAKFPADVYYPKLRTADGQYQGDPRTYKIAAPDKKRYAAYRMVIYNASGVGEYYGVQGTTWMDPPILSEPSETRKIGGRKYNFVFDGKRCRLISWKTDDAVYWISNTLPQSLTVKQMTALATSVSKVR